MITEPQLVTFFFNLIMFSFLFGVLVGAFVAFSSPKR